MEQVEELKKLADDALQNGDYILAINIYTEALTLDENDAILFCHRSATYCTCGQYDKALADAEKTILLKPGWGKGYLRKGIALAFMGLLDEAIATYVEGISQDPSNVLLKDWLRRIQSQQVHCKPLPRVKNPFQTKNAVGILKEHPVTRDLMRDPNFQELVTELSLIPTTLGNHIADNRIMVALGVLLDLELQQGQDQLRHYLPQLNVLSRVAQQNSPLNLGNSMAGDATFQYGRGEHRSTFHNDNKEDSQAKQNLSILAALHSQQEKVKANLMKHISGDAPPATSLDKEMKRDVMNRTLETPPQTAFSKVDKMENNLMKGIRPMVASPTVHSNIAAELNKEHLRSLAPSLPTKAKLEAPAADATTTSPLKNDYNPGGHRPVGEFPCLENSMCEFRVTGIKALVSEFEKKIKEEAKRAGLVERTKEDATQDQR